MDVITETVFVEEEKKLFRTFEILRQAEWSDETLLSKLLKAQDQARDYLVNFPEDLEELTRKLAAEKDGFE